MTAPLAHVAELWRYPVKGMRGEQVDALEAAAHGIAHDRRFAFQSSGAPRGKPLLTGRERAAMLLYRAECTAEGVQVTAPGGDRYHINDPALLCYLEQHLPHGNRMRLLQSGEAGAPFTDVRPISVLSKQSFDRFEHNYGRSIDPRCFRTNIVLRFVEESRVADAVVTPPADAERALTGATLRFGDTCRLRMLEKIPRCRIVTLDPETAQQDPSVMKHLDRYFGGRLGVYASVAVPGTIRVGDPVFAAED